MKPTESDKKIENSKKVTQPSLENNRITGSDLKKVMEENDNKLRPEPETAKRAVRNRRLYKTSGKVKWLNTSGLKKYFFFQLRNGNPVMTKFHVQNVNHLSGR